MRVPAVCDNCGTWFPSPLDFENCTNVSFSNIGCGPCPKCGGSGHVPDGMFNFLGDNTIEVLSAPERSLDELRRLQEVLRAAREKRQSGEELAATIRKETPNLAFLASKIPPEKDSSGGSANLVAWITLALMVLQTIIMLRDAGKSTTVTVNEVINQTYNNQTYNSQTYNGAPQSPQARPATPSHRTVPPRTEPKIGRNEQCPCGSQKKYKKCHGALT